MNKYPLAIDESKDENGVVIPAKKGLPITLDTATIPELADYAIGDTVDMHVTAKVTAISNPKSQTEDVMTETPQSKVTLEVIEAGISDDSLKPETKEAARLGLDKTSFTKLQSKRGRGTGAVSL